MEIIISYAFAHIIEAIILWMSMSQMYEHRYKQWVTGIAIMAGHAVMFGVFLTGNIYFVTVVNLLAYILLIYILYNVNKRAAVFWGGYLHSNYGSFRTNDILCITIHNEN